MADATLSALAAEPASPADPAGFALAVRRRRVQSLLALKKWSEVVAAADAFKKDAPNDPLIAEVEFARAGPCSNWPAGTTPAPPTAR